MFLTLCYAYATVMQWWRLRTLKNKLNGTLNAQNALLVCSGQTIHDSRKHRSLENLLFKTDNRIACTIVPKQKVNLSQWIAFPKNLRYFPIHIVPSNVLVCEDKIFVLVQAILENYVKHQSEIIQVENFGELVGWKATDSFEVILKTDLINLTKLINQFAQNDIDINHELRLLKIETIDVEGTPTCIKYEKKYLKEQTLKYSYAPVHWNKFVAEVKELYAKIRDITNPKIKIENGSPKCFETNKKNLEWKKDDKHYTLEVAGSKRHKAPKLEKVKDMVDKSKQEPTKSKPHKPPEPPDEQGDGSKLPVKNTTPPEKHRKILETQDAITDNDVGVTPDNDRNISDETDAHLPENLTLGKPPNILIYADSVITKDNVKRILYSILDKERYIIYDFPISAKSNVWNRSTVLVVVCGTVPPELTANLIQYFLNGGQLFCLCSDLMYSVLHTFTTAEVREHELVRFTYGSWERVKMMHHIFCYQASPAKKQFSKDSDQSNHSSNGSSPLAPRTPSNVELRHNDKDYNIQVQVLGTEETWQTPSLLLAKVKSSKGKAVFSQVHLEIDPNEYEKDEDKYRSLLSSNEARLEILKDILSSHLDLVCDENFGKVEYGPGYFLGRFDAKMDMISNCESISQNHLKCDTMDVFFFGQHDNIGMPSCVKLPVLIHSCPPYFSTLDYFEALDTESIGRLVIYTDVLTSSQNVLSRKLRHGLAVISRQQTNGVGRTSNKWLTPMGCAAFSLQMHISLNSPMGKHLSLIQHLVMVAVVSALKKVNGCDILNIGIKWPNDLYADASVKIGGLIVTSTIDSNLATVNIGCGVNLSNQNPTTCINDLIDRINRENNSCVQTIAYEKYFAIVFNEVERLYNDVQNKGINGLLDLYYQHWLHRDAAVTIQFENGGSKRAKVVGIDEFGFLRVRLSDGTMTTVQPDGNTFDMMSGLIAPKPF